MPSKNKLSRISRLQAKIRDIKAFLSTPEDRVFLKLATKYIVAYTAIPVLGTHTAILVFEGVEMWEQVYILATISPVVISLPIIAHGVSVHFKALKLSAEFKRLLEHDSLTGLRSRRYVLDQLYLQPSLFNYIFMIDMDRLKRLNDQIGHLAGDAALKRLATVLTASAKEDDVVGRLSGDEFMILSTARTPQDATQMARNTLIMLSNENQNGDSSQAFTISIGIAQLPEEARISEVIHKADRALYRAKEKGGNCIQFGA